VLRLQSIAPDSIPLEHGYVGVKNRDTRVEEDGETVQTLEQAAAEELEWFQRVLITIHVSPSNQRLLVLS
jgi:hypothetical protein